MLKKVLACLNKDIIISLVVNTVFLGVYLSVFIPRYEINDDMAMYLLSSGAFGESNPHLIFSHHFLGYLYEILTFLYDGIKWYSVIQYCCVFASFVAVCHLLLDKWGQLHGLVFTIIIEVIIGYQAYVFPQFTKVAGITTVSGIVCFYYWFKKNGLSRSAIVGAVLAVLGSMYRFDMALIVGAIFAVGAMLDNIILVDPDSRRMKLGFEYKRVLALVVLAGIIIVLHLVDGMFDNAQWKSYKKWQANMASLTDHGCPSYAGNQDLYDSLGITEFDISYYSSFNMGDRDKLTDDTVQKIVDAKPSRDYGWQANKESFIEVLSMMRENVFGIGVVAFLACYMFLMSDNKSKISIVFSILVFGLIYYVFTVTGRKFINRVDIGIMYTLILSFITFGEQSHFVNSRQPLRIVSVVLSLPILGYAIWYLDIPKCLSESAEYKSVVEARRQLRSDLKELTSQTDNVYISSLQGLGGNAMNAYGVFDIAEEGELGNIYLNGGWCSGAPSATLSLRNHGLDNGFSDVIEAENAYIVEANTDNDYFKYVRDNYSTNGIEVVEAGQFQGWTLYQIRSVE